MEELIDKAKEISQCTRRWYRFCADFEKELARQLFLPRLRLLRLAVVDLLSLRNLSYLIGEIEIFDWFSNCGDF